MIDLPIDFSDQTFKLTKEGLDDESIESLSLFESKGYEVHYGLSKDLADQISKMSLEPAIKEYCLKDWSKRFIDRESTKAWLGKHRAAFLLVKRENENLILVGYGWTGTSTSPEIPNSENTFAIRIGEIGRGQGLATPFARLIVQGSSKIYGVKNIWLETWQSNAGAVHVYHKIGFKDVKTTDSFRVRPDNSEVPDTRIYMTFPNELLS